VHVALEIGVDSTVLLVAVLLLAAVLTAAFAARPGSRFRVPGALLFLALGMAVGDDGLAWITFDDPNLARDLGVVALLLILFEGGLTTKPTDLRLAAVPGLALATLGVVITAAVTGFGVWLLVDVDPLTAGLIGAVVASTDAAAVFSMMRTTPLPRTVAAVLRIESGANDPIAVMLTVGLLATLTTGGVGPGEWVTFAVVQLLGGVAVGGGIGVLGVLLLRRVELGVEGLYPVLALAIGGAAYGVAAALGASGFVAVYLTGLAIGGFVPRHRRTVLGVHEALANAAEVGLFLLLGLLVFPSRLPAVALSALAVSAVLILVARPAAVWLCTLRSGMRWRERTVVSWAGLRGAVPIVLATFPYTAGVPGGDVLFDVVFFVVLVSVLVQGTTLEPLVRRLGLARTAAVWSPVAEALPLDRLDVDLVEVHVTPELAIAGRRLKEVGELPNTLVAAIVRSDRVVIPKGDTRIEVGDVLLLTAQRDGDAVARLTAWARGERARPSRPLGEPYADG
jgi:cell volume regulation protein A